MLRYRHGMADATTTEREILSWATFGDATRGLAQQIADSGFEPDIVLAVARGGLTVAGAVAYALGVKNCFAMNVEFYTGVDTRLDVPVMLPPTLDLHVRYPFHGGVFIDAAGGLSNLVGEFLIHGYDIARAAGRPWAIEARDALLIMNGVLQISPAYAEPGATGPLKICLRSRGAADWVLDFNGGRLDSRAAAPGEAADVVMRAPAETLLLVFYSRIGTLASLRGGMLVTGGRRPWRIATLAKHLQKP